MDCAGLLFVVMMIIIWLDDAGFWKWLSVEPESISFKEVYEKDNDVTYPRFCK